MNTNDVVLRCPYCGTTNITNDALAVWSPSERKWVVGSVLHNGMCLEIECGHDGIAKFMVSEKVSINDKSEFIKRTLESNYLLVNKDYGLLAFQGGLRVGEFITIDSKGDLLSPTGWLYCPFDLEAA